MPNGLMYLPKLLHVLMGHSLLKLVLRCLQNASNVLNTSTDLQLVYSINGISKKRKKRHYNLCHHYCRWVSYFPVLSMKYSLFLELCCVSRIRKTWDLVLPKNTWLSSFPKILKKEKNLTRNYNNWTYFNKLIKRRANPCIMLISSFGIDTSSYNNLIKRTWSSLLNFLP